VGSGTSTPVLCAMWDALHEVGHAARRRSSQEVAWKPAWLHSASWLSHQAGTPAQPAAFATQTACHLPRQELQRLLLEPLHGASGASFHVLHLTSLALSSMP
jgi:hypothetical protein